MKDGHIQQVGTPSEVYHQPANTFVARFIGAPSMNLLSAVATDGAVTLAEGKSISLSTSIASSGRDVLIGVRPDDLHPDDINPIISGKVTVLEPLGPETLIYVETPSGEVIAKADGRSPPKVGETVNLGAGSEHLHVFDAGSGDALK